MEELSKYKLLYLNQTLGMGGAESFMRDLLVQLQKLGWSVQVTAVHDPFIDYLQKQQIKVSKVPVVIDIVGDYKGLIKGLVLWPIALLMYFKKFLKYRDADVILVSGFVEKLFGTLLALWFRKPIVWVEFASITPLSSKFWGLPGFLYKLFLPYPKFVITSSQYSAKFLKSELPSISSKIVVIPCGLKTGKLTYKNFQKSKVLSVVVPPQITCVSRLEKGKGQDYLLKAFKKVLLYNSDVKLNIIGIGETLYSLEKLSKKLGIEQSVVFKGYVKDAKLAMSQADICVVPTLWKLEGFGMVVVEAMSLKTPVVAFDFGPIRELITHGHDGLLTKPADTDDLAQNIIELLRNQKLATRLTQNAYKTFKERFTIEKSADSYQKYLLRAIFNN